MFFFYDLLDQEKIHIHQQLIQFWFFQFRGEFYYMGNTSGNGFSCCSYGEIFYKRDMYRGGKNFCKTYIFWLSL